MQKVSLVKCNSYDQDTLYESIKKSIDLLGGISCFIKKDEKVLIKPNLLAAREPEDGVNTHPEIIRAVVRILKQVTNNISIGDSPGGYLKVEDVYDKSGLSKVAQEEGVKLVKFDSFDKFNDIPIAKHALEADRIISIPKLKVHDLMVITAALKNIFGIVPGLYKAECHRIYSTVNGLAETLFFISRKVKVDLVITDAITSMHERGPASGKLINTNLIITGSSMVAVDTIIAKLIKASIDKIPLLKVAYSKVDFKSCDIEVVGEDLEDVLIDNFKLPKGNLITNMPGPILKLLARFIKFYPEIDQDKCKECGICIKSCPVGAITKEGEALKVNPSKCILCLCCSEFCPHDSVGLYKSRLLRMLRI